VQSLSAQTGLSFTQIGALPGPNLNLLDSNTYGIHAENMCKPLHMTYPNMFPFGHVRFHEWGIVIFEIEAKPPYPKLIKGSEQLHRDPQCGRPKIFIIQI
jgi:hypothetical protein